MSEKSLNEIEARAKRRDDKPMLRLIAAIRKADVKAKNKLHTGDDPPAVGDDIYVPTRMYIDHGEDDVDGGLAEVVKVKKEGRTKGVDYCIYTAEHPNTGYYWSSLKDDQERLKKEHGKGRARVNPDYG